MRRSSHSGAAGPVRALMHAIVVGIFVVGGFGCVRAAVSTTPHPGAASAVTWVALDALPPETRETLALVDAGGAFPFRPDGRVFANREGHLPARPRGTYREYTVPTPGAGDRGARRLVVADGGRTLYSADDHYRTFLRIRR